MPLLDEEVANMGIESRVVELGYAIGDSVRVISGALSGFVGVVKEISEDKKKIMVLASMFGRETPVELDADCRNWRSEPGRTGKNNACGA